MPETSASHLRTLAADAEALQQRLRDALAELDGLTPNVSFQPGEAFASLGSAAQTLDAAASEAASV
ncbi:MULTISPECIES: hypothetical protein [unclassified Streptomyces]|jgi:hypothetical protein|uniref:hypothetical protein n=1 Tax=unclassified Streptomyces TaxID=2593676 RepID=UPI00081B0610|nr:MULTISPECIES: hypothetical protein [unclassified Streptomyces]MYQ82270.1 hypothetical protein [Streptomyces sp. SID4936]SCD32639.1 hypothetical protein GA0115234_100426 [Streptomyces sp. DvalAA-43]